MSTGGAASVQRGSDASSSQIDCTSLVEWNKSTHATTAHASDEASAPAMTMRLRTQKLPVKASPPGRSSMRADDDDGAEGFAHRTTATTATPAAPIHEPSATQ